MRTEQPSAGQSDQQPAEKPANKKRKLLSRKAAAAALAVPWQATAEQPNGDIEHSGLACSSRSRRKTAHAPAEDKEIDAEAAEAVHSEPFRSRKSGHKRAQQVPTPRTGEPEVGSPYAMLPMEYWATQAGFILLSQTICSVGVAVRCCLQSLQSLAATKHLTWDCI